MSLVFAEGFEHFHQSSVLLQSNGGLFTPKTHVWRHASYTHDGHNLFFNLPTSGYNQVIPLISSADQHSLWLSSSGSPGTIDVRADSLSRKGGKFLAVQSTNINWAGSGQASGFCGVGGSFVKSRTAFFGIAIRIPGGFSGNAKIIATFGRSVERFPSQLGRGSQRGTAHVLGGCIWKERGGYADLEWCFLDQPSHYSQIFHGRNLGNGDWHFLEFGTTVYGNSVEAPLAWGTARIGSVESTVSHINTAVPGTANDSFIDTVSIRVGFGARWVYFDDFYVCNDEGSANNNFLGNVFVRPVKVSHDGALRESLPVNAETRYHAVGQHFCGHEGSLPSPLPSPESSPFFEPWSDPRTSHIVVPKEGGRQNFRCTSVPFGSSNPRIFGATIELIASTASPNVADVQFSPIKSLDSVSHEYPPSASDLVGPMPALVQMAIDNPRAQDAIDVSCPRWSSAAVNSAEYGFKIDSLLERRILEEKWNPALLRYPVIHEQEVLDEFGMDGWASRHWEEVISVNLAADSSVCRWDWACRAFDIMATFDESFSPIKTLHLVGWTNARLEDSIVTPEEYVRDFLGLEDANRFDSVARVEEELGTIVFAYHEHVEELRVWLDPYDHVERAWAVNALDDLGFEVSDIFDGHFDVEEEFDATVQARSNHELLEETLYAHSWTQHGLVLPTLEDELDLYADHFGGNWVEQFEESFGAASSILTRHWRFEFFMMVCIKWWEIGVVEQPLDYQTERQPCDVKNDNIIDAYKSFFGIGGHYDEVANELKTQWIHLGGDPYLDFFDVRWASFDTFVFDGMGNVVDMLDAKGNSIIEVS